MALSKTATLKLLSEQIAKETSDPYLNIKEVKENGKTKYFLGYHYSCIKPASTGSYSQEDNLVRFEIDMASPDMLGKFKKEYFNNNGEYKLAELSKAIGIVVDTARKFKETAGVALVAVTEHSRYSGGVQVTVDYSNHGFSFWWTKGELKTYDNSIITIGHIRKQCDRFLKEWVDRKNNDAKEIEDCLVKLRAFTDDQWRKMLRRRPSLRDMVYRETRK